MSYSIDFNLDADTALGGVGHGSIDAHNKWQIISGKLKGTTASGPSDQITFPFSARHAELEVVMTRADGSDSHFLLLRNNDLGAGYAGIIGVWNGNPQLGIVTVSGYGYSTIEYGSGSEFGTQYPAILGNSPIKLKFRIAGSYSTITAYSADGLTTYGRHRWTDVQFPASGKIGLSSGQANGLVSSLLAIDLDAVKRSSAVFLGDSLTFGYGIVRRGLNGYPGQLLDLLPDEWIFWNYGVSGYKTTQIDSLATATADALYDATRPKNYAIIWAGTNDLMDDDAATSFTRWTTLVQNRINAGFEVIALTVLPRSDATATHLANRAAFNTSIKASALPVAVIDLDTFSELSNPANGTYYGDGTHVTAAGAAFPAGAVANVIAELNSQSESKYMHRSLYHSYQGMING